MIILNLLMSLERHIVIYCHIQLLPVRVFIVVVKWRQSCYFMCWSRKRVDCTII